MGRTSPFVALALALAAASFGAAPPAVPTADLHGDPLPAGALARLGTARLRHGHPVSALAFSRDGKFLASAASDHTIRIWDASSARELRAVGEELARAGVYSPSRWITAIALSPDGKTVASASNDHLARLWDTSTGKELILLNCPEGVTSLAFAPDGKRLATACRGPIIRLWDPAPGNILFQLAGRAGGTYRLLFSPDNKTLAAAGFDGTLQLWDVSTRKVRPLPALGGQVHALAFSADGKRLAAGGSNGSVRLWETATGKEVRRLDGLRGAVAGLAFTPDGKSVVGAGTADGQVWLWDAGTGKGRSLGGPPAAVTSLALSPDGKTLALGGSSCTVFLWDMKAGRERGRPAGHRGHVHLLAFSPDGRRVTSGGADGAFYVWDAATGRELRRASTDALRGAPFAFSSNGRVATRSEDGGVSVWEPGAGKELCRVSARPGRIVIGRAVISGLAAGALSADGRTLAAVREDGSIQLWESATGRELRRLEGHRAVPGQPGGAQCLTFSPDGKLLATAGADGVLRLVDVGTGQDVRQMAEPGGQLTRLAFSADGQALAGGGMDGVVAVWETFSGKKVRRFTGHRGYVLALAFSPDGRCLAAGSWMGARLWDLTTGEGRGEVGGHKGDVMSLAFSPDGRLLATGSSDTTALLWDVARALPGGPPRVVKLSAKDVEARWADLAGDSGEKAYQAVWDLAAAPAAAVPFLAKHLEPVRPASAERVKKLIADLADDDFDVRTRASRELEKLGETAEAALRKALDSGPDVDLRLRLNVLLRNLTATPGAATLRALRAVQVLELVGTPAAEKVLRSLAGGAPEVRLTREAKASLARLARLRR
jgi:WD40 repeat protein